MRRRFPQRVHDAVKMILRIRLKVRVPYGFFAEDHIAINDRRGLAITTAEIKADAAAVKMPARRRGRVTLRWQTFCMNHLDRMIEHPFSNNFRVKFAGWSFAIIRCQPLA